MSKGNIKRLNELFGSYRAEWLKEHIFDLFSEPSYFTGLQDARPCILQGGRGTGKTTVLRGLSYQGQFALHNKDIDKFNETTFLGIYHRINTNHVRAFVGGQIDEITWGKVFSHYFNLLICREILLFLDWHSSLSEGAEGLNSGSCELIAKSLHIKDSCGTVEDLLELVNSKMYEFQSDINNIEDGNLPALSMAGDPIRIITEHVLLLPHFRNKVFFILLDEYENYENYQQQIINSLLKHNSEHFTFKIGVREMGWRVKHTHNETELLHDPADYILINIEEKLTNENHFNEFARGVCQQRIEQLLDNSTGFQIEKALGNLSIEDESLLLGVEKTSYVHEFHELSKPIQKKISHLHPLYKFFIAYWAKWHDKSLVSEIEGYLKSTSVWDTRYENYKYEMLFKIKKGKVGINKYYSGWNTYIKLANGNIRYLMELVYKVYEKHLMEDQSLENPISAKNQTETAKEVGKKNLMELEGLSKNGAQLTKLLLALGRVFNILACHEGNTAPEQSQFSIKEVSLNNETNEILNAAVMHLALVKSPGNKLTDQTQTRAPQYSIHPIFSAYFVFSYRKKRKILLDETDVLGLINEPKKYIDSILKNTKVLADKSELPEQLSLFESFYK